MSFVVGLVVQYLLIGLPFFFIYRRVGFSPWFSLIVLVPVVGWFVCWLILAVRDWPWPQES